MRHAETARQPQSEKSVEEQRGVQHPIEGIGPLFQRDYVAVIADSPYTPEEVVLAVRTEFPIFPPKPLAEFSRPDGKTAPLEVNDTMHVFMPGAGHSGVVLTHLAERSFTLRTQQGHFETGRITFGCDRDEAGRLVFRIRSYSTISTTPRYLAYRYFGGMRMQREIWTGFAENVAVRAHGRLVGEVVSSTDKVEFTPADWGETEHPTFFADPEP